MQLFLPFFVDGQCYYSYFYKLQHLYNFEVKEQKTMDQIAHLITQKNDPQQVYQLLDILGQGSYGSVHKALHMATGQLFAIKILPATSGVQISAIKKQIGILKQCDDDHIVKYYGSYFKDDNLWIVMEYCIAGSVADIMQITKKKFNEFEIASILESVLYGLDYLHTRKKIHRDIKAANILLDQRGNAKLADFGVSASSMHTNARFRTHIGSPYWMSPEIIKFSEYTYKTDIWSLGITAIELAQGQVPNSHIKPFMAVFMIKSNPVQSFKDPSLWSPQFNSFIKQCLEINPASRPQAKQLLNHPFIRKYSKGQRLLSELVLNLMSEIEQFRMNQSNNSSFAEIIIDEAREYVESTKTIVEGNSMVRKQSHKDDYDSENDHRNDDQNLQNQFGGDGSMIIIKSESNRSQTGTVIADSSMIQYNDNVIPSKKSDPLTSYINGLKQESNVEVKCAEKLVHALNSYDEELTHELNKLFNGYKEKVQANIQGLEGLRKNNTNLKVNMQYTCKIRDSNSLEEFLQVENKNQKEEKTKETQGENLLLNSRIKTYETDTTPNSKVVLVRATESTHQRSKDQNNKAQTQLRDESRAPIKSFLIPNSETLPSEDRRFKKSYNETQNSNGFETQPGPIIQKPLSNTHNSSRIMIKRADPYNQATQSQVREFVSDPQVIEYLREKNYLNSHSSIMNHTKSTMHPVYTCTSINSRACFNQQRSAQKSKSKSKNKMMKNTKSKKMKVKMVG